MFYAQIACFYLKIAETDCRSILPDFQLSPLAETNRKNVSVSHKKSPNRSSGFMLVCGILVITDVRCYEVLTPIFSRNANKYKLSSGSYWSAPF